MMGFQPTQLVRRIFETSSTAFLLCYVVFHSIRECWRDFYPEAHNVKRWT